MPPPSAESATPPLPTGEDDDSRAITTAREMTSYDDSGLHGRGAKGKTLPPPLGSTGPSKSTGARGQEWLGKALFGALAMMAGAAVVVAGSNIWGSGAGAGAGSLAGLAKVKPVKSFAKRDGTPRFAQVISPKSFAVLDTVQAPSAFNGSSLFVPPGSTEDSLKEKPFHIYDDSFYDVIGSDPTLTLLSDAGTDPLFHEAVVWHEATDEVFFVQNAGAPAAGTGLNKSAIVQKISLSAASAVQKGEQNETEITTVKGDVQVINPNGGTSFRGKIIFTGEGQGDDVPSALYLLDPTEPYNTSVILNNFYGRQFNSLNDVAINPRNKQLYFTDVTYGYLQDFRSEPILPNQVYRYDYDTGAIGVVADGMNMPNGIAFSPDGQHAYISDTGIAAGFWGTNYTRPSTIYRYDVQDDGSWDNKKVFAYSHVGPPDGIHTDSKGNLYAGVGDGVHVFNPAGVLIGKIYLGELSANFNFAGEGRLVICAETRLYYVTFGAAGWSPE
ncbi:hypothetical protein IAT38_002011 [Cryptococcus sp. DSM 104549]